MRPYVPYVLPLCQGERAIKHCISRHPGVTLACLIASTRTRLAGSQNSVLLAKNCLQNCVCSTTARRVSRMSCSPLPAHGAAAEETPPRKHS